MNLELTKDELRALDLALQSLLKQQGQVQRVHTAHREDVALIDGVAGKVRDLYVKEEGFLRAISSYSPINKGLA